MSRSFHRAVIAATFGFAAMASPGLAASEQDAALIEKGKAVYAAQKCSMCHIIEGKGKTNPLDGVGKKLTADEIRAWIVTPQEMEKKTKSTKKPKMQNKYSKLPAADIDALVAYMQSLK